MAQQQVHLTIIISIITFTFHNVNNQCHCSLIPSVTHGKYLYDLRMTMKYM